VHGRGGHVPIAASLAEPVNVDLSNCDREPIHVPGSIQPHGMLAALSAADLRVRQVSANCERFLGVGPEAVLGRPFLDVVLQGANELVVAAQPERDLRRDNPLRLAVRAGTCDATVSRLGDLLLVELEDAESRGQADFRADVRQAALRLQSASELHEAWHALTEEIRRITGFDRVMVYRFHPDEHGEVVAESKAWRLASYLGLHYPASDIPAQARRLYAENWLRLIPSVDYEPSPLVPLLRPDTGEPLDLSHAILRSVSPIHCEYLRNMGVAASMSISLMSGDRLWGLVACHHYAPRHVPADVRISCEMLGQTLSWMIAADERARLAAGEAHAAVMVARFAGPVGSEPDPVAALTDPPELLLQVTGATGAVVFAGPRRASVGTVPPDAVLDELAAWLPGAPMNDDVLALDAMPDDAPKLGGAAAGLLAIGFPREAGHHVAWFRPEQVRTVSWGADPDKLVTVGPLGDRLTPRGSFEQWKQTVRGRSRPWSPSEIAAATSLRRLLMDAGVRRATATGRLLDVRAGSKLVAMVRRSQPEFLVRRHEVSLGALAESACAGRCHVEAAGDLRLTVDADAFRSALEEVVGAVVADGAQPHVTVSAEEDDVVLSLVDPSPDAAARWARTATMQLALRWFSAILAAHGGDASVRVAAPSGAEFRLTLPRGGTRRGVLNGV
jgi:chemotaxis family two-component system sensor kinase Cph1